ncbi:MAG: AhpC/TSA family protein [Bacteroides sp.]|nr:AhpC/TSA family protein [Bacteroides sp.]
MNITSKFIALSLVTLLASCSGGNKWHIDGKITGLGENDIVVLEGNNQGYWYPMDTIEVSSNGSYSYSREAQGYPDIYRLRVGDKSVYFPIDSIESVTLSAEAPDIDVNYTLGGSQQAESLVRVDSMLRASADKGGAASVVNDTVLKRNLGQMIVADPAGIVTYYIINKKIAGKPLFNPAVKSDLRMIGAVANSFNERRPSDPRTGYLRKLFLDHRPKGTPQGDGNLVAYEVRAFDIKLYDNTGKEHSLLDETSKGNVVLLNFTAYTAEDSPAFNVALNNIYEKYKSRGFEIFQVAFDEDEYAWKQTAKNLPWITVLNGPADGDKALRDYNVGALPAIFIFDRNGDVVERVSEISRLEQAVSSRL